MCMATEVSGSVTLGDYQGTELLDLGLQLRGFLIHYKPRIYGILLLN